MTDLLLKQRKKTITNKQGQDIEITVYYVIVNDVEIILKPYDFTCQSILEKYYKENK